MKKIEIIRKDCSECYGEGFISQCCQSTVFDNRCENCNRFCKKDFCCEGYEDFKVGDEVFIFVCVYSPGYLRDLCKSIKKHGDTKTLEGKIVKLVDSDTAEVKIKRIKESVEIKAEEMSLEY